ncbi:MAG TPA: DUF695 domain-containing protein [Phycisphaerales bacterium]|nr:DUF695 domain-containing protein [Phycisphaerales bacterium]
MSRDAHADTHNDAHDEHDEAWQPFERVIDDRPFLALVRTDWTEHGPDRARPVAIIVTLGFAARDNGLPTPEVFECVRQADDAATAALESACKAICVGTLMGNGARSLYFYASSDANAQAAMSKVAAPGVKVAMRSQRDAAWQCVVDDVWPTPEEIRWNADKSVLDQLEEAGDDMSTPRPIEHLAILPSKEAAAKFVEWLREEGFELTDGPAKHEGAWHVEFSQTCAPDIDEIYDQTSAAAQMADELGGEYDGWQCGIVKSE